MPHIFLSYAREDVHRAKELATALEASGVSVWWDRSIPPGRTFDDVIEEALAASNHVIVLWSSTSVESKWVRNEAMEGDHRGILVPAFIERDVKIPFAFRRLQAADLVDWHGDASDPRFQSFLAVLKRRLSQGVQAADEEGAKTAAVPASAKVRAEAAPSTLSAPPPQKSRNRPMIVAGISAVAIALIVIAAKKALGDKGLQPPPTTEEREACGPASGPRVTAPDTVSGADTAVTGLNVRLARGDNGGGDSVRIELLDAGRWQLRIFNNVNGKTPRAMPLGDCGREQWSVFLHALDGGSSTWHLNLGFGTIREIDDDRGRVVRKYQIVGVTR